MAIFYLKKFLFIKKYYDDKKNDQNLSDSSVNVMQIEIANSKEGVEKIIDIFKSTEALLEGHFVLTSGRHSAAYFQCAKVLQFPEHLTTFGSLIAKQFSGQAPDLVITPAIQIWLLI